MSRMRLYNPKYFGGSVYVDKGARKLFERVIACDELQSNSDSLRDPGGSRQSPNLDNPTSVRVV